MKGLNLVKFRTRKRLVLIIIVLILVAAVAGGIWYKNSSSKKTPTVVVDSLKDPKYIAQREQFIKAIEDSEKDAKTPEEKVANYRSISDEYVNLKRYNKAIEEIKKAIAVTPNDYSLHAVLGELYAKNGDKGKANQAFDKALSLAKQYGGDNIKLDKYTEYINREKAKL